jgi:hypothetical protein
MTRAPQLPGIFGAVLRLMCGAHVAAAVSQSLASKPLVAVDRVEEADENGP